MIRSVHWLFAATLAAPLAALPAHAQQAVFRAATSAALPGLSSDATSLMAVADVGSLVGPPDGIPDIVVGSQNQLAPTLYGRPDGTFVGGPNTQLGRIPTALVLAEVTGDDALDMIIADTGNNLLCFRGFDDGPPFQRVGDPVAIAANPVAIEPFDFDGDGRTDIAVLHRSNQGNSEITLHYGLDDCTFAAPPFPNAAFVPTGLGSSAFIVDDFNGDGVADFAVANALGNDVSIIRGAADGSFSEVQRISVVPPPTPGGSQLVEPVAIAALFLDADGNKDLAVVNRNGDQVAVLLGRADGTFGNPSYFPSGSAGSSPTSIAVADLDGDGYADVVVANNRSSDVSVLRGDGAGGLVPARTFMADQEPLAVSVANFPNDGLPSVVVSNRGSQGPNVAVLRSMGDGALGSVENVATDPSPNDFAIGDLDNDGFPDLAVAHSDGSLLLLRSLGGSGFAPFASGPLQVTGSVGAVVTGDFDGDLLTDVAVASDDQGTIVLFRGRPGGAFAAPQATVVGGSIARMIAGDWDGNGVSDLAVARQLGDERGVIEILVGGAAGLSRRDPITVGVTPLDLGTGDVNDDGHADLLVANSGSGSVSVLRGRGDGSFEEPASVILSGAPRTLAVADFDRDGCDDFVVGLSVSGAVVPYFGGCDSTFERGPQSLSAGQSPSGLAARDFAGDGIADVAIVDEVDNFLSLYTKLVDNRFFTNLRNDNYTISRRPVRAGSADFDGDGRYDAAALNSFVAGSVSILTNDVAPGLQRGDANGDESLSAADLVAVLRTVLEQPGKRLEDVSQGRFLGAATDANGDGVLSRQDVRAVAARLFPRS